MKRWKGVVAPAIVAAAGVVFSCTSLPDIAPSVCGNRVVDLETEDCDEATVGGQGGAAGDAALGTRRCGAPGAPAQCRILCSSSAECGVGWSCGLDGVCREPRGTFARGTPLPVEADDLAVQDFDGDGIGDVISWKSRQHPFELLSGENLTLEATPRLTIHYGEAAGDLEHVYQLHISNVPVLLGLNPAIGHVTTDVARGDIVLTSRGGVSIFHGQADRTLLPILNPSLAVAGTGIRPLILNATAATPADEVILYLPPQPGPPGGKPEPAALVALDAEEGRPDKTVVFALFKPPRDSAAPFLFTGRLHETGGPGCDEIVVAFEGDKRVTIVTPCSGSSLNTCTPEPDGITCKAPIPVRYINLPASMVVTSNGMKFGDLDGDGHLDVVIDTGGETTTPGTFLEPGQCFALGTANGNFKGAFDGQCFRPEARTQTPLAFGQITQGDSVVDVVTSTVIFLRTAIAAPPGPPVDAGADATTDAAPDSRSPDIGPCGGLNTCVQAPPDVNWTEAHVLDINGDGFLDIVAASSAGLDVYEGTGDRVLNHASYATSGGADLLVFSDYDGDGALDIAFRQRGAGKEGAGKEGAGKEDAREPDTISILFGRLRALPENPIPLGRLRGVDDIRTGIAGSRLFGSDPDGLGEISIISHVGGNQQITILSGAIDRRIVSSFALPRDRTPPGPAQLALTNRFAIGRFTRDLKTAKDPHDDLAILSATHFGDEAVLKKSDYGLWLAAVIEDGSLDASRVSPVGKLLGSSSSGRNGEAVEGDVFWPFTSMIALDLDKHEADTTRELDELLVLTEGLASKTPWKLGTFEAAEKLAWAERDATRDVGAAPAKLTSAFRMFAMDVDPKNPKEDADDLVLLLREGETTTLRVFFNRRTGKLDPTPVTLTARSGLVVVDAAPIRAHAPNREIALLAKDGVYLAHLTATGIVVDDKRVIAVDGAKRIAVGDVSGDRIDDVVVLSDKGIQVFRGEPRLK